MIVLDCSAAVEMVRDTPRGRGFAELVLRGERIITSSLFQVEVRNAFWKYVKAGLMSPEQASECVGAALELVDELVPLEENAAESFVEAARQGHSVYDMLYLTLARRNVATLFTSDKKLAALCEKLGVDCIREAEL